MFGTTSRPARASTTVFSLGEDPAVAVAPGGAGIASACVHAGDLDLLNGLWVAGAADHAAAGGDFVVRDPASADQLARVADGTREDAERAVAAAADAFPRWAATSPRDRSEVLRRAFELMIAEAEPLAQLITRENGKPIGDARAEVVYAAEFFRWFSEEAVRTDGEYGSSPAGGSRTIVTRRPVGVAALVTPWNFPAAMATRKIAPALAAGCAVVLKPAEETPLTALALAQILARAGVPPGVVNVVPTQDAAGVVSTWMSSQQVRALSFTGSTGVGRTLLHQAADRVVNASMELGGNAPFVVTDDVDLDAAVSGALIAKFRNGGQACTAANRFLVHAAVVDEFVNAFGTAVEALRVGPGTEPATDVGPMVSRRALTGIQELVDNALDSGARVSHRAELPPSGKGYFFPPTVLRDVSRESVLLQTEIFGPVAAVVVWDDEAELLDVVNGSEFGLAAYVYSRDLKRALQLAESFDAGMVGINRGSISDPSAPFGGMKQSGLGREGAREGLREFQETQYFSVDWS